MSRPDSDPMAVPTLEGKKILVADDDHDSLELLRHLIGQAGGTVRGAGSARETLALLLNWTPDVMLLDISMPDMNGYDLLAMIRGTARLREIPAIAVTAHAYEADRKRCIEAGFVEHVAKPYEPAVLLGLISQLGE